ncbi:phosphate butyryltransferase [Virgibacillus sp. NKC19-16]|uniref:phosphate butyryltransferase n=1 Tax=Virgibacillus salidurans TaxID=2831673 RepID=UPI001F02AF41|nr:phosphate butyryltransferase [Virgibacillus sp. NKC19-16]UJL48255.1 phosphate butyryltransferase [Virgibacillus sp. NKC19-16]
MKRSLASLKWNIQQETKQIVSVANAADKEVLIAVKTALKEELCFFLLFGDETKITNIAESIHLDLSTDGLVVRHESTNSDIARSAVMAVHHKEAQILMKGNLSTNEILKAVLNKEYGLRTGNVLSHVALFEIPNQDRLLFLTDAAMNITPSLQEKVEIINNAVQVAHGVGLEEPKVAALAPVEVINQAMPSTVDAAVLTQMNNRGQIKDCLIDGPLAFDNAVSLEAASHKNIHSDVGGTADILMVPTIEVGNALYKSFIYFANATVAAIISGAKAPIILTSRADSAESKIHSLTLALVSSKTF